MGELFEWLTSLLIRLVIAIPISFLGAIPLMWLFGFIHEYMPAVYPFGYGSSVLIAILVAWAMSFLS